MISSGREHSLATLPKKRSNKLVQERNQEQENYTTEIAIFTADVPDKQTLIDGLRPGIKYYILSPDGDGLAEIATLLANVNRLKALHIISHGAPGKVFLGRTELSTETLTHASSLLRAIRATLTNDGNLLLYGCEIGAGRKGQQFIKQLATLTGVNVATSATRTGNQALGGDWKLGVQTAPVKSPLAVSVSVQASYPEVLATTFDSSLSGGNNPLATIPDPAVGVIQGDFDSDGDVDVLAFDDENYDSYTFYQNDGSGSFSAVTGANNPFDGIAASDLFFESDSTYIADFDNDGDQDIWDYQGSSSAGDNRYLENIDGQTYTSSLSGGNNPLATIPDPAVGVIQGDFDSDGDVDVLAFDDENYDSYTFYQNDGSGSFSAVTGANNPFDGIAASDLFFESDSTYIADFDNDGDQDIWDYQGSSSAGDNRYLEQNIAPTASGTINPISLNDNAGETALFDDIDVSDTDTGETDLTLRIQVGNASAGTISGVSGTNVTNAGGGIFNVSGSFNTNNIDTALDNLRFTPTDNTGDSGTFNTDITVKVDGQDSGFVDVSGPTTVTITRINDAPTLTDGTPALNAINEDAGDDDGDSTHGDDDGTNNNNNPGTPVSTLLSRTGGTSDPESATLGIAVVDVTNTNGTYQYSTDGGASFTSFSGSEATDSAVLLAEDDLVRFIPNPNFNGSSTGGLTFKAWDQTSGNSGDTGIDTTVNSGEGSNNQFSSTTDIANITVNPVNDAPTLTIDGNQSVTDLAKAKMPQTVFGFATFDPGAPNETSQSIADFIVTETSDPDNIVSSVDVDNNGDLTFTPASGVDGTATIEVQVQDDGGGEDTSSPKTFNINVDTQPSSIVVDTLTDESDGDFTSGDVSLREALEVIEPGGTITFASFDPNTTDQTIDLTEGQLNINKDVTIDTEGQNLTIDAGDDSRIFFINDSDPNTSLDVSISGLTISGGDAPFGGGIFNGENLSLSNSTISSNDASEGGGIFNSEDQYTNGTATVTKSTISDNIAIKGGGIFNEGTLTVSNSTISGNEGSSYGGGIDNQSGTATVINSTISGNEGFIHGGGIDNDNTLNVINSTISGNFAIEGGGIDNSGTATISNSIVANSSGDDLHLDSGTINTSNSLIESGAGEINGTKSNNITGQDPDLGSLQDNGGPTETHLPSQNNAGDSSQLPTEAELNIDIDGDGTIENNPITVDQRGETRISGGALDIGAVERQIPNAQDDNASTNEDQSVTINVVDNNDNFGSDGASNSAIAIATNASNGNATVNDNGTTNDPTDDRINYTPDADFNGSDNFTYQIEDSNGDTSTATVNITINPVNDAPTASDNTLTLNEDTSVTFTESDFGFSDVDSGDTLDSIEITSLPNKGRFEFNGKPVAENQTIAAGDISNLVFTPAANENGTGYASFDFTVSDGELSSSPANTITLDVTPVNDIPTGINLSSTEVDENVSAGTTVGSFTTEDPDTGDSFSYSLVSGTGDEDNSSFSIDNDRLNLSTSPEFATQNSYNIRIQTEDSGGETWEETFTINVNDLNDAPTVNSAIADQTTPEDEEFNFTFPNDTFNDIDAGDSLTYNATNLPNWLSFDVATRTFSGTPTNEEVGSSEITVIATDQDEESISNIFTLTVDNVNDAPTLNSAIADQTTLEDETFSFTFDENTFNDVDAGDSLSYSATNLPDWLSFDATTRTFRGIPSNKDVGNTDIEVTATDQAEESVSDTFTLTVDNVNDTPSAINLSSTEVDENVSIGSTVGTLTTQDPDTGDSFSYTLVSGSGDDDNNIFSIDNNRLNLNASPDFESQSSYNIRVQTQDSSGQTFEETFIININDVNDIPIPIIVLPNDPPNPQEDTASTELNHTISINVLANDSDPDNDPLSVSAIDASQTSGMVTNNEDDTITYDPNGQFEDLTPGETATDTFTYTISDGNGGTDTAQVSVTINGMSDDALTQTSIQSLGSQTNNINLEGNSTAQTQINDFGGRDTYTVLPTLAGNVEVTDNDISTINLPEGLTIDNARFLSNGVEFTINGHQLTLLGTPKQFSFVFGGTPLEGNSGTNLSFQETAQAFGTIVPPVDQDMPNQSTTTGEINPDGTIDQTGTATNPSDMTAIAEETEPSVLELGSNSITEIRNTGTTEQITYPSSAVNSTLVPDVRSQTLQSNSEPLVPEAGSEF